jgi:DNA-binding NarL/FixJ family response regulator
MNEPIRVIIVEDHALVRTGLRTALRAGGFDVVGEAPDGISAEELAKRVRPDVAVVDLGLPGRDGIELVRRLSQLEGGPNSVVLTTRDDETSILASLEAGASGYCLKSSAEAGLLDALRAAARGASYLDADAAGVVYAKAKSGASAEPKSSKIHSPLTNRETEILTLIAQGGGNATIALQLNISLATVKTYVAEILRKLTASDRAHAASIGLRRGYIS